jgi:hypothetical protein
MSGLRADEFDHLSRDDRYVTSSGRSSARPQRLVPTGLILPGDQPSDRRRDALADGAAIMPDDANFLTAPVPVVHIISASLVLLAAPVPARPSFPPCRDCWHHAAGAGPAHRYPPALPHSTKGPRREFNSKNLDRNGSAVHPCDHHRARGGCAPTRSHRGGLSDGSRRPSQPNGRCRVST